MIKNKPLYLIGIGGMGMTSLANLLIEKGYKVYGSDIKESKNTEYLRKKGVEIFIGHKASNIKKKAVVVYSSAISLDNPELLEAKKRNLPVFNRYEFLMEILKEKKIIAISGTHGKSTTSSMISYVLQRMGLEPTVYIGATSTFFPYGSEWGRGEYAVVETDEHDKSFLITPSFIPVILNVDNDHLAYDGPYKGSFSLLKEAFRKFEKVSYSGYSVLNIDDPFLNKLKKESKNQVVSFGLNNKNADFIAKDLKFYSLKSKFLTTGKVFYKNELISEFKLRLPGKENVLNFLTTLAVIKLLSLDILKGARILQDFRPINRRFNVTKVKQGFIIDDHADHPTEIRVSLTMVKQAFPQYEIILVLQPHRYSRVALLYRDYAYAIKKCDYLILLPLDPAGEKPIKEINSERIYEVIIRKKIKPKNKVIFLKEEIEKNNLFNILKNIFSKKRIIVFMGPGKISTYASEFIKYLKE